MEFFKRFFAVFAAAALVSAPALAQKKDKASLEKINQEIERKKKEAAKFEAESRKLETEIKDVQKKLVAAAASLNDYSRRLSEYDRRMSELQARERQLNRTIEGNNAELVKIIAVFENMGMAPKGYMLASPSRVENIFHSSLLLRAMVEQLDAMRVKFRRDLDEMLNVEADIAKARKDIAALSAKAKGEKGRMDGLAKDKQAAYKRASAKNESARAQVKKLVAESKTIEEFLKKAEELRRRQQPKTGARPSVSRRFAGRVPLPATGRITAYFGDKRAAGVKSKGLYIQPKAGAQVVSPVEASAVFAGSFYGYKNLLILRSDDGYYVIIGGMENVMAGEGQSLLAGEPVGEAGGAELYIEVREDEKPIDPLKYFRI